MPVSITLTHGVVNGHGGTIAARDVACWQTEQAAKSSYVRSVDVAIANDCDRLTSSGSDTIYRRWGTLYIVAKSAGPTA